MEGARREDTRSARARGPFARAWDAVVEYFTLSRARAAVRGYGERQGERVRALFAAATARADAANAVSEPQRTAAALVLHREAARLYLAAALVARDADAAVDELRIEDAATRLEALGEPVPEAVRATFALFAKPDLLALDLEGEAAALARQDAEATTDWLRARVEARTPERLFVSRVLRALGALLVLSFAARVVWQWAFAPKNLALGAIAIASSRYPGTPDPQALVDGDRSTAYGAHTQVENEPWVQIDLGRPVRMKRVRVWSRTDGYQDESLPIVLETGDGPQGPWTERARKTDSFSEASWDAELGGVTAQRIRFRLPRHGYLTLGEVEVFGE
jgi:hypothetical protein